MWPLKSAFSYRPATFQQYPLIGGEGVEGGRAVESAGIFRVSPSKLFLLRVIAKCLVGINGIM